MTKSLVICCDGTWNTPDQGRRGIKAPTNVAKMALGLAREDADGRPQLLHYERGVGTRRFEHVRGGMFGFGLSRNVRSCYRFVVDNYEPGDRLYFLGFSRGAYTARSTVGLIRNCGVLRAEHRDRIDEAYSLYRDRDTERTGPESLEARLFRRMYSHEDAPIHFLGVWDTVGSLGVPIDGLPIPQIISRHWTFHDTDLSSHVASAYQALAIDEQRRPFTPTLWTRQDHADGQLLEQVWFAGAHSDVGGGYPEPELAEIPLLWMVDRARARGLAFEPDHFVVMQRLPADDVRRTLAQRVAPDALGRQHDSFTLKYRLLGRRRRRLGTENAQSVASSAVERVGADGSYRPAGLRQFLGAGGRVTGVGDGARAPGRWRCTTRGYGRLGSSAYERRYVGVVTFAEDDD